MNSYWASLVSQMVKNPPANAGDAGDFGSILGLERSPGGENGSPLQYSCWDNPMDRGAWWATVHGVAKSQAPLTRIQHLGRGGHRARDQLVHSSLIG